MKEIRQWRNAGAILSATEIMKRSRENKLSINGGEAKAVAIPQCRRSS